MSLAQPNIPKPYLLAASVAVLVILLMAMQGSFVSKTVAGETPLPKQTVTAATATAEQRQVADVLTWPGTVRSKSVAMIAPKMTARILAINVRAGDKVNQGDVLVRLDQRDIQAQINAAKAAVASASAEANRASADAARIKSLYQKEAATRANYDASVAQEKAAQAAVRQASSGVNEIKARLDDAVLRAPFAGVVVKRLQEPGDMGLPGVPALSLQQPQGLRLEAQVPGFCAGRLSLGMAVTVRIAEQTVNGTVAEIVPEMDAETRSQLVKIALPEISGLHPGQFGWLEQACGQHTALLVPASAVLQIGQLEAVKLANEGAVTLRHVRTAKRFGGDMEIISGLEAGETVIRDVAEAQ